jgi:hypothetical protein
MKIYVGEQRDGRIKFTDDKDCLSPDIIRFEEREFVDNYHLSSTAFAYERRGFQVCIDTQFVSYETGQVLVCG